MGKDSFVGSGLKKEGWRAPDDSRGSGSGSGSVAQSVNPDPKNFKVLRLEQVGKCLVVLVNYPNSTNFEGNKILLFRDFNIVDFVNTKILDPHFSKDKNSPFARFVPTDDGWDIAFALARQLDF